MARTYTYEDLLQRVETLEERENTYRHLFESAMVGIYRTRIEDGKFLAANLALAKMMGYESVERFVEVYVTSKSYTDPNRRMELLKQLQLHGQVDGFEAEMVRADGSPIQIALSATAYPEQGYLEGVIIDITDRKQSEEALRASHKRFLTVLDSIDATIYVADMQTYEILFMNKNMIDSFGKDFVGEICWDVFRGELKPCQHCTNHRLIDKNRKATGVYVWQVKNPITGKWYINYDRAIEWTDGRLVRLQIATDITEFKKMEERLRQTHKMEAIGTLAGGIAHNFNNLLMGIQGHTSLMSIELDASHPHMERINAINEYIQSAVALTSQLLGFVRGGKYEVKPIDLNELVLESAKMFGRTRKEIQIHTDIGQPKLVVEADRAQIEQVLLNLYINAWQAMPDGGELYLETSIANLDDAASQVYQIDPGCYVKISVTDTGVGMNEATCQRIFDPFFTTKDNSRGTGLGLASAYGIIKNHHGIITVSSEVGHRTTFNIYLPASEKKLPKETATEGNITQGSETILLIDDEKKILEVAQAMLTKLGYHVVVAGSGKEAVQMMSQQGTSIALVILDLIMPGMDGGMTFDRIRDIQPEMPVLISSGYAIDGQATEILNRGCNGFIQKPYSLSELSKKIRQICDGRNTSVH